MDDSRETLPRRAFVAGFPVKHSRSPLLHGHWLKTLAISGAYERQEITPADFPAFIAGLKGRHPGFIGGNVTIPHKEQALVLADHADPLAKEIGAANTLWIEDGKLCATNTDAYGFLANLDQAHPGWARHKTAVVFGAGGAARAVLQALRDRGFGEIRLVNRTITRALELRDRFGATISAHGPDALSELMSGAGLFVNTTSLGMDGAAAPCLDFSPMAEGAVVTDIVYVPLVTPFLAQARAQGLATVDGLGMLLHQAVPGFEKWFGTRPVVDDALRALIVADLSERP